MEWAFIHLPKCGGTSMRSALGPDFVHVGPFSEPHIDVMKAAAYFGERWDDAFTFSFVRNPWDRVVSLFHHRAMEHGQRRLADPHEKFRGWLMRNTHNLTQGHKPRPAWLGLSDGEHILVDFVGRFEQLHEDYAHVCHVLGKGSNLPRRNISPRERDWRPYYTDDQAAFVAREYACDLEHFGYGFNDCAG